jgi:2-methylcitrate dehydratase PrpD
LHPVTDAMRELRTAALKSGTAIEPNVVKAIELSVCPYVMTISGVRSPESGMQAKFSVFHTAAVGLLDGDGGVMQYTDARVRDAAVLALREKVRIKIDEKLRKDQSRATLTIAGRTYHSVVEHALGTIDNPMNDEAIETKFLANADRIIGQRNAQRVIELVSTVEQLEDVSELARLCAGR